MGDETLRTAVYIDGYNLYYGRLRGTNLKWLDVFSLCERIIRIQEPRSQLTVVKFFTANALERFATHGRESVIAQQSYHRALETLYEGRLVIKRGTHTYDKDGTLLPQFVEGEPYDKCKRVRVWRLVEKQTDVNLALAMYRDAAQGRVDQVVIVSNDSDAEPALEALKEDYPELRIGVITPLRPRKEIEGRPHRTTSSSLARQAHWVRHQISDEEIQAAQLPAKVPTKKKPILKPVHWNEVEADEIGAVPPEQ